ncbi:hypothetical protein KIPB_003558 [Kipferlia bialata]|uniref:Uncharacterized protein n=1 Tax=Kipferlia bialata TaxID=797122 RepID=A0A391NVA9_9EUKA|nr:hypothetical protein KIPB_003558 [Kipferlia bialata]|eukprot:g3558.t1
MLTTQASSPRACLLLDVLGIALLFLVAVNVVVFAVSRRAVEAVLGSVMTSVVVWVLLLHTRTSLAKSLQGGKGSKSGIMAEYAIPCVLVLLTGANALRFIGL